MNNLGGLLIFLPLSLSMGTALLRYRLYDIDRIINRTLVYGTLTLTAVYVGLAIVLQALLRGVINEGSSVAIATLFQLLRHRPRRALIAASTAANMMRPKSSRLSVHGCAAKWTWNS